jgi:YjbE family integral membrane protein
VDVASAHFWLAALQIIFINVVLSGDNAVVIALACRKLPARQRRWGVLWGALGAIVLRIALTFFAVELLELPWVKIVGGVLLLWIGVKLISEEDGSEPNVKASERLWTAIQTVIIADLIMSLDNVVAVAAAARGSFWLLVFGLTISIPLVVVGAQLIMRLIHRFPVLVIVGGGLLGFVAGEMIAGDEAIKAWVDRRAAWLHWAAPALGVLLVIGMARVIQGRHGR